MWKMDDLHHPIGFSTALTLTLTLHNYDVKMSSGLAACTKRFLVFSQGIGLANSTVEKSCMSLSKICQLLLTSCADHYS